MNASLDRRAINPTQLKRWAAEHVAIDLGLLRECPYHGEPYRTQGVPAVPPAYNGYAPLDPLVSAFRGDAAELLSEVERVAGGFGQACPTCARQNDLEQAA